MQLASYMAELARQEQVSSVAVCYRAEQCSVMQCRCVSARQRRADRLELFTLDRGEGVALHCTAPHRTTLHCSALHCTARPGVTTSQALHCTDPHRTTLHCSALHCIARPGVTT